MRHSTSLYSSIAFFVGTQLDVFTILDEGSMTAEEVGWYLINLNWEDKAGYYAEEDYREMLEEAGFKDITRETLPNGDGLIHAVKA